MLGRNESEPTLFQMVNLDALVPPGHRLRRIDAVMDLSFVRETVEACYKAGQGRPSVDPELALRMMLLGVLYDLPDRELCDEIAMHAGFRWFCRLNFHDPVPDHSTLSRLRNERWAESGIWEKLRDEVLRQCRDAGLLSGRHLSTDGTQVEANASMKSLRPVGPRRVPPEGEDPPAGGTRRVQEPAAKGDWKGHGQKITNQTHRSISDPDARMYRKGKKQSARLSYLVHDLIDTKGRVILRTRASLASSFAERDVTLEQVDEVLADPELLPARPEILTADAGYGIGEFVAELLDRGITPHVPLQGGREMESLPTWKRRPRTLVEARSRRHRLRLAQARNQTREEYRTRGYQVSRKLRIRSEHVFAEAKTQHGLRRARRRGLEQVQVQAELTAAVQNLKRLAAHVHRRRGAAGTAVIPRAQGAHSSLRRLPYIPIRRPPGPLRTRHLRRPMYTLKNGRSSTAF